MTVPESWPLYPEKYCVICGRDRRGCSHSFEDFHGAVTAGTREATCATHQRPWTDCTPDPSCRFEWYQPEKEPVR